MGLARHVLFVLTMAFAAAGTAGAGTITVFYAPNANFTDAGINSWDREANMRILAQCLQSLGRRYLPAEHALNLEVLDVDLAGDIRMLRRNRTDMRVARGAADWPRIVVRYSLQSNGHVLKAGTETVADMDYLHHVADRRSYESLHYEKRMLEEWFKTRFSGE